jgi:hypothetical protein
MIWQLSIRTRNCGVALPPYGSFYVAGITAIIN